MYVANVNVVDCPVFFIVVQVKHFCNGKMLISGASLSVLRQSITILVSIQINSQLYFS